jgi:hypothetical protein
MTLVFEGMTILGMNAFYPALAIVSGIVVLAVIIYHIIKQFDKKRYVTITVKKAAVA